MADQNPAQSTRLIGRKIERVEYDYDDALRLHFDDGSMLYVSGTWHNDSTAGTQVAHLYADDPKSYEETKAFYEVVREREWRESD